MGCGASNQQLAAVAEPQPMGNKKLQEQNHSQLQQNKRNKKSEDIVIQDLDVEGDVRTELKASPSKGNNIYNNNEDDDPSSNNLKAVENHSNQLVQLKRYKKGELIDKGAYGKVYKGIDTLTNEVVAIKYIQISGTFEEVKKEINSLKKEITLLKKLNHPNIVKYYDFDISDDKSGVDIILEYVPNGSLRMALNRQKYFDETKTAIYTKQILEGLEYLHKNNIIHRDLKGANLLLDFEGRAKLTDFGTAKQIESDLRKSQVGEEDIAKMNKSLKGTPNWMAPEVIERVGHTSSADIWSIGCIVIEMISGKPPYPGLSAKEVFTKIASGGKYKIEFDIIINVHQNQIVLPEFPRGISYECQEFLESCLQIDPKKRLTCSQLLKTPFILRKKIRRPQSQNSLVSQEELLEQIKSIQQGQSIQQEYQWINKGSQPSIKGSSSSNIKNPLIVQNHHQNSSSSSQPVLLNKPNPYSDYQYKNEQKYQQYQDSQLEQLKERTRSLNQISNEQKIGSQNQINKIPKQELKSKKSINAEDDILKLAKSMKRQQEYVQANVNPGYEQYVYKPKNENTVIKFTTKEYEQNQNPSDQISNNFSRNNSRQNTYSQQKTPAQQFRSSLVDIKDEEEFDTTEMVRRSQKSLTLLKSKHKNLNEEPQQSSQPQIGSVSGQRERLMSGFNKSQTKNQDASSEDLDIELPQESKEIPISRSGRNENQSQKGNINFDKKNAEEQFDTEEITETNQSEPQQENEYLKHENKVISTKSANQQRMMLNKQQALLQQRQPQGNKFYEIQNQVINTDIAQRERDIHIQEQQEFQQDKVRRKQLWEEELKKELEFQKQNPPPYMKYY